MNRKPPIVLVHGFRGAPAGLGAIAMELERNGFKTYSPKIPPFAGAGELFDYNPHTYADYIASYIAENHLEKPILIGHSMGSVIAAATASLHPEIIHNKLVFLSPISKRPSPAIRLISPTAAYLPRGLVDLITTYYLFVPHDYELFKETLRLAKLCSATYPPKKSAISKATRFSTDYTAADFELQQQVVIIAGEHDKLIDQQSTKTLADKLHAELEFLPNTGHLHNYEQPQATAQAILHHL